MIIKGPKVINQATRKSLLIIVLLAAGASSAHAYDSHLINTPDGKPIFELRYFYPEPVDGPYGFYDVGNEEPDDEDDFSQWDWRPELIQQIDQGVSYWASLIQPQGERAIINIGTEDDDGNASAESVTGNSFQGPKTLLQMQLQGDPLTEDDKRFGMHATFGLGEAEYGFPDVTHFSQIPITGEEDLVSTAIHELGHGFGLDSPISNHTDSDGDSIDEQPYFNDPINLIYGKLLVDDNGNYAKPGQEIWCSKCDNLGSVNDAFDVRNNNGRLVGPHINEVLAGAMPGIPVSMTFTRPDNGKVIVDPNNMSHSELKNSMMSHQNYRNYTGFMEAELALLQDLGYKIDRKNFFGKSIYGDNLDIVNTQGFYARNANGTTYIPGEYNTAILGLGLHVYGSHNNIHQAADILTAGPGGAGIRVDGEGNNVVINPGTHIYANGDTGQGILFAYGKNHSLIQRGVIQALGYDGVGIRFDFGNNALSDEQESRGSYIHTVDGNDANVPDELAGPLVKQADITGSVAGKKAAIYISENAYVKQINLMQGAQLQGDVISLYKEEDANDDRRITTITFGKQADASGKATNQVDNDFVFNYQGDFKSDDGDSNLQLDFVGGTSILRGEHEAWGVDIQSGATLAGESSYLIIDHSGQLFLNQGTLIAGSDNTDHGITIMGDYTQKSDATLLSTFNHQGEFGILDVKDTANLDGTVGLRPLPDWYANDWEATIQPVHAYDSVGNFVQVGIIQDSPTLKFSITDPGQSNIILFSNNSTNQYTVTVNRPDNAYTQYAKNSNDVNVGQALSQLAAGGSNHIGQLFTSLDFSNPNGQDISNALPQLSASAYSAAIAASIRRDRMALSSALQNSGKQIFTTNSRSSDWRKYASLFGQTGQQNQANDIIPSRDTLYGVVAGASHWLDSNPDFMFGFAVDASEQTVDLRASRSGQAKATAFGISGLLRYQPDAWSGFYATAGIRLGVERGHMTRNIGFADYSAEHKSSWTAYQAGLQIAGGYLLKLGKSFSIGPYGALDYNHINRPSITESGPRGSRLRLSSEHNNALRSRLGLKALSAWETGDNLLAAHAQITWDHELISRNIHQSANFAEQSNATFDSINVCVQPTHLDRSR